MGVRSNAGRAVRFESTFADVQPTPCGRGRNRHNRFAVDTRAGPGVGLAPQARSSMRLMCALGFSPGAIGRYRPGWLREF